MLPSVLLCISLFFMAAQAVPSLNGSTPVYKNPNATIDDRVEDLLSRMTIEDKTSQLIQGDIRSWINVNDGSFNASGLAWSMQHRAGSYYVGVSVSWELLSRGIRLGQDYLMQNTTLGIPAWVQSEGIHGFRIPNATIFNSPIAYASSFNPALVEKTGRAIAKEALALGVNNLFAPLADLARELRYGRVEETFGEDPYLAGEMAYSYVKGLQSGGVAAMVKHFAAFATPEQGLNTGPVHGGRRELLTTYLPPFKRAIIDGEALSVMSAYHAYDGIPAVADKYLLTDVLRTEWGYKYFVQSDSGAPDRLCTAFSMCESNPIDSETIVSYALPAGTDIEMGGGAFNYESITKMVKSNKLSTNIVDEAVRRQLRAKFTLGLFEKPYSGVPLEEQANYINTPETITLARQLDAESIVLLENHRTTLPLKRNSNIAVIGPMAHGRMNYGDYVSYKASYRGVTPLDGIKLASTGTVTYAQGCLQWSNDQSGFPEAVAAANGADVAIVVVGTWSRDQTELWQGLNATTGEHVDVNDLHLVGAMPHLVKAIIDTGKPTVVVFSSGKPITEPWISDAASALVQQFYPSEQGGNALADVLFGDVNPSGKLAVGFPVDVANTPSYYDFLNSGRGHSDPGKVYTNGTMVFGHTYVLSTPVPLYEFGYGLSYSTFIYTNLSLSTPIVSKNDRISVTVSITNNSTRDGTEVVQLYVRDIISSVVVPNLQLKGFAKVAIAAGATEMVRLGLNVADLGLWDINLKYVVEPGNFTLFVGSSSADLRSSTTLTVV